MIFGVKIFFIRIIQISGNQISLHCRNLPEQPYIFAKELLPILSRKLKYPEKFYRFLSIKVGNS